MADSAELIGLLHQIRGAARPLDRLRLATLAWRTLRSLGPVERMAVAKALGVEGAERLVEQLGTVRGISPSALMTAIRKAEEADPDELRRLIGDLRDPETREAAAVEVLGEVEDWLVEEQDHVRTVGPETEPMSAAVAAAPPDGTTAGAPPPAPGAPSGAPVQAAPSPSPAAAFETSPIAAKPPPSPPGPAPAPGPRPAPAAAAASPRPSVRVPTAPTARPTGPPSALLPRLEAASTDLERLRLLDRHRSEIRSLSEAELRRVASLFPDGWRRRRALEALCRAGAPTSHLLALLAAVRNPGVTAWVLASLAERGDLEPGSVAGESPTLLRRLRLRQARSGR